MNTSAQPKKTSAAIMNIRIRFSGNSEQSTEAKIEKLSNVFNLAAPAIVRNGGTLTCVAEEGIVAIFENSAESALRGALDVFQDFSAVAAPEQISALSVGIHTGTVYLARMSYQNFSVPVAISEGLYVARKLSTAAEKYDAKIMMTQTAHDRVRSCDTRYNCRKLGVVYLNHYGREETVYDLFDSDPTNLKYRKKRSKLVFETGVNLFLKGEYHQSRNYFIELLKYDRNDRTAKEYIFMCDRALSGETGEPADRCLEIW